MGVPEQLPFTLVPEMRRVDPTLVVAQPTLLAAIKLCISMAGLEADKALYIPLGIDAGHWTRIHRGEAHFPIDKLPLLMDLCGNEAPLIWLVHRRGYDPASLRRRETETERMLREAQERIASLEQEREVTIRVLKEIRG